LSDESLRIVGTKEDFVSNAQLKLQANILHRLKGRKEQRLSQRDFEKAAEAIKKQLGADSTAIEQAVETLLRDQYVSRTARGTYKLEEKGADYLSQLDPDPVPLAPEINEATLPYQKAFVLMQLFCAEDYSMPQGQLRQKLSSAAARNALLFARMSSDPPVNPDRPTMDWVVHQLVQSEDVKLQKSGQGARCTLTARGQESLVATDQHPSLEFRLKGKQLNALREPIRLAGPTATPMPERLDQPAPSAAVVSPVTQPSLTTAAVLEAFEELRRERFARNGIVPVFELRRLLIARHGAEAGSHAALDPLLKQMRREKQLRMVAIGNLSQATTDQLDDSVPGENETFFYIEAAHEHAHV
jgi:hypothetical protein